MTWDRIGRQENGLTATTLTRSSRECGMEGAARWRQSVAARRAQSPGRIGISLVDSFSLVTFAGLAAKTPAPDSFTPFRGVRNSPAPCPAQCARSGQATRASCDLKHTTLADRNCNNAKVNADQTKRSVICGLMGTEGINWYLRQVNQCVAWCSSFSAAWGVPCLVTWPRLRAPRGASPSRRHV